MKGVVYAIQKLSKDGVGVHNLYKFFMPEMATYTVRELGLDLTPEQLSAEWLKIKDQF